MAASFHRFLIGSLVAATSCLASAQPNEAKTRPAMTDGTKAAAASSVPKTATSRAAQGVASPGKTAASDKRNTDAAGKALAAPLGSHDAAGCHGKDSDA